MMVNSFSFKAGSYFMKKLIIVISLCLLGSCGKKEKMKIEDLKFSNIEQRAILKNGIKKTYLISGSSLRFNKKYDTIGYLRYNEGGNIIEENIKGTFGTRVEYKYDSLNIEVDKKYTTDFVAEFNYNYEFDPDSLILYKKYKNAIHKNINGQKPRISGKFKFNRLGFLVEKSAYQNNDLGAGGRWITEYKYDSLNRLKLENAFVDLSEIKDTLTYWHTAYRRNTTYFYTHNRVDSAQTVFFYLSSERVKKSYDKVVLYDKYGLVKKTILSDSIVTLYSHQK